MKGYTYILECFDGSFYTGSTTNLELRLQQHQNGEGANHTRKHLPVELVYFEEYDRIDVAFEREKQIQGWSRKKKKALINGQFDELHKLAECQNESHYLLRFDENGTSIAALGFARATVEEEKQKN
jgi:putative endonuclease